MLKIYQYFQKQPRTGLNLSLVASLAVVIITTFFLTGCFDQQMQEDYLKNEIKALLSTYQKSINNSDQEMFSSIISDKFSFFNDQKEDYISKMFNVTFFIDDISFSNVRVENYKVFSDIDINGSIIMKPSAEIPLFKEQMPFINGNIKINSVFAFAYEQDGLKILSEDQLMITKSFSWGENLPALENITLSKTRLIPGDELTVNFSGNKGSGNDAVFFLVNNYLIGGGSIGNYFNLNNESYTLHLPADLEKGDNYEVTLMAIAGQVDLYNPKNAKIKGIKIITYSVPVR